VVLRKEGYREHRKRLNLRAEGLKLNVELEPLPVLREEKVEKRRRRDYIRLDVFYTYPFTGKFGELFKSGGVDISVLTGLFSFNGLQLQAGLRYAYAKEDPGEATVAQGVGEVVYFITPSVGFSAFLGAGAYRITFFSFSRELNGSLSGGISALFRLSHAELALSYVLEGVGGESVSSIRGGAGFWW